MTDLSEEEFQALYAWVDEIPLSRQKKNVARDFSDGGIKTNHATIRFAECILQRVMSCSTLQNTFIHSYNVKIIV